MEKAKKKRPQCAHVYQRTRGDMVAGERCPRDAAEGSTLCWKHNNQERERAKKTLARAASRRLRDFVELEPENSELIDPFSLLTWETRRSIARIKWYDEQLMGLKEERNLWWGKVKEEQVNATEFAGVNKTYEARQHELLNMQDRERKRLQDLFTFWTNTKLEAARIATIGVFRIETNKLIRALLAAFEIDTQDTDVRAKVAGVLAAQAEHLEDALELPEELR